MTLSPLEALHSRWNDLIFRDFSLLAQQLGGISSDKVNAILSSTLSQSDPRATTSWLRLIVALHFQLGKLAEFTLDDRTMSALLQIIERTVQQQQQHQGGNQGAPSSFLSDLCVILLSLNTATAVTTVGIENQLCALFLVASADHQRVMLPLVHRSFYSNPSSSLSADTFQAMIRRQALDGSYHEFLRLYALIHSSARVLDEFTSLQLLATSPAGPKPMFGSVPIAIGLDGVKCNNNRLGAAASLRGSMAGGPKQPTPFFTLLHTLDVPTAAQVHHCYVVSAYGNAIRRAMRRLKRGNGATGSAANDTPPSPQDSPSLSTSTTRASGAASPTLISLSAAEELTHYLHEVFLQATFLMNGKKCHLYCTKRGLGLRFIEGVISECLYVSKHLCLMHKGTSIAQELAGEVTNFLYCAMRTARTAVVKAPTDEVPELRDVELSVHFSAAGGGSSRDGGGALPASAATPNLAPGGSLVGDPLFSPDVMVKCLEFQIAVAPIEEVLNFFEDIFGTRMWDAYLERHESFAVELCLALERNAVLLKDILPSLAPRVMWLLSQQPHVLFPVVKRLIQPMMSASTNLDIFFRIVFLPLICFSNSFAPPPSDEVDEDDGGSLDGDADFQGATSATFAHDVNAEHDFYRQLWASVTDWAVDTKYQTTKFAEVCIMNGKRFPLWNALHRSMGFFDGRMTIAYRLIRPLMTEYFKSMEHLPTQIFSAIRTAYFFLVSPQDQRHVVTDYLLEMGRWAAEMKPALVQQSTTCLIDIMQQEFIPAAKRSWQLQRWAALVAATGLSLKAEDDVSVREAAVYFEVLHVMIWELVALASTVVTIQYQASLTPTGSTERDVSSAPYKRGLHALHFAHAPMAASSFGDILSSATPYDGGLAADYIPEARLALTKKVAWDDVQPVWVAPNGPRSQDMCGVVFTEHMHSLVVALAILSKICPNVKERGIICLANLIRTLLKSKHSGSQLATMAAICLKLLRFPTMSGLSTMPLHALLGLQVLRGKAPPASAEGAATSQR